MLLILSPQFPACCENGTIYACKALRTGSDERHEQITLPPLSFLPHSSLHAPSLSVVPLHPAHSTGPRLATKVFGSRDWWQVSSCLACAQIPPWHTATFYCLKKQGGSRHAPWGWHPHRQRLSKAMASPYWVDSITSSSFDQMWVDLHRNCRKKLFFDRASCPCSEVTGGHWVFSSRNLVPESAP